MRFHLFTLVFDPITERFNDEAVQDFLADKDVESVSSNKVSESQPPKRSSALEN
jgi:hypothetical protein